MMGTVTIPTPDEICERDASGETVLGMRVAAYRETHPEHGNKFGHIYSEHWSTPNWRHPNVKVERLFTEKQVRALIQQQQATIERLSALVEESLYHLRLDEAAKAYHERALTALGKDARE